MTVGDRPHDRAYCEAVEVVIHEDQHTQDKGSQNGAHPGFDVLLRPAAESRGAAGGVDEGHHDAQQHQEQEDAGAVGNGGHKAVVDDGVQRGHRGKVALEQGANQNADKQGREGLLGDQGQNNGHHRGDQGPEGAVHTGCGGFAFSGEGREGQQKAGRDDQQYAGPSALGSHGTFLLKQKIQS